MQSGGEARYNPLTRKLTGECDSRSRDGIKLATKPPANLFQVVTDRASLRLLTLRMFGFIDCLLVSYISGRATCRLGSGGH
jgi:hypothetical protein